MLDVTVLYYGGVTVLALYLIVAASLFHELWKNRAAKTPLLRKVLVRSVAALSWPYAVWCVLWESYHE